MSITAMKLALEALKYIGYVPREDGSHPIEKAITALRTAIAEAEACEPVAYQEFTETGEWFLAYGKHPTAKQNPLFLAAGAQPAPKQEPRAWINYKVITDKNANFAGLDGGNPGFTRLSYGYDWSKAEPLYLAAGAQPAQKQEPVPAGYQLVPVEPTDKMVQASLHLDLSYMPLQEGYDRAAVYKAMLAAAKGELYEQTKNL